MLLVLTVTKYLSAKLSHCINKHGFPMIIYTHN